MDTLLGDLHMFLCVEVTRWGIPIWHIPLPLAQVSTDKNSRIVMLSIRILCTWENWEMFLKRWALWLIVVISICIHAGIYFSEIWSVTWKGCYLLGNQHFFKSRQLEVNYLWWSSFSYKLSHSLLQKWSAKG